MSIVIIIFLIVATVFAIATLIYVAVDLILEKLREDKEEPKPVVVPVPVVVPAPEPEPEPEPEPVPVPVVMHEIVEHIDAEEADEMLSDELAMQEACYERGAGKGKEGIINIGAIDKAFEAGSVITLAVLKEKKMISKRAHRMKVLADGILNKPFVIKSESYSVQAIKMIELTGGTVIILKD